MTRNAWTEAMTIFASAVLVLTGVTSTPSAPPPTRPLAEAITLAAASVLPARDETETARPPRESKAFSLKTATIVFAAAAADWVTTTRALQHPSVREQNPMIGWAGDSPAAMVAIGVAINVAGAWTWNHFVGKHHKKVAAVGLYITSAWHVHAAVQNEQLHHSLHHPY